MKFAVEIWNWRGRDSARKGGLPGWAEIDKLREAAGYSLPLALIGETLTLASVGGRKATDALLISISEETARKAEIFKYAGVAQVCIVDDPAPFWTQKPVIERDSATGEVTNAYMEWAFDEQKFLALWEASGFPEKLE